MRPIVRALQAFPERVATAKDRLDALNPEFVDRAIAQLMIQPGYNDVARNSLTMAKAVLYEALRPT